MNMTTSQTETEDIRSTATSDSAKLKEGSGVKVVRSVTIRQPASVLYAFWRRFENLSKVIRHPTRITSVSANDSKWIVTGPGDHAFGWTARIINEVPDKLIAWQSLEGADTVRFEAAPGDEGTELTVALAYDPPGGKIAAWFSKLTGEEPAQQVADTLRRFKALMETDEMPTIEGQSVGEPQRSKQKEGK
jgi:uncharacterized membrane protein